MIKSSVNCAVPNTVLLGGSIYKARQRPDLAVGLFNMMVFNNSSNTTSTFIQRGPLDASAIATVSFLVLVMLLTILGNSLVCFCVLYYRRLRSPTNYLIVSLAVSDFLVGILSLPFRLAQTLNHQTWPANLGREGCQFWIWIDMLCCGASIVNLAGISVDRLLAIKRPLRYREVMTSKKALVIIAFVWVYAFFGASLSFVEWGGIDSIAYAPQCGIIARTYITIISFAAFFCPLSIVVVCYGLVLHVAIRHALELQREKESIAVNFSMEPNGNQEIVDDGVSDTNSPYLHLKHGERTGSKQHNGYPGRSRKSTASTFNIMKQLKATKTLAIVVGVFIISWFPFFVIFLTFQYCGNECFDGRLSRQAKMSLLNVFVLVLPVFNSAANPIIYSCFNREFRTAFLKTFYRLVGKRYRSRRDMIDKGYTESSAY